MRPDVYLAVKVWSQLALAYNTLARLLDALYLIFKFVLAFWQSSDNDVRSFQHTTRNKQTLANLEFVLGHTSPAAVLISLKRAHVDTFRTSSSNK
jgi:hypothetical protein